MARPGPAHTNASYSATATIADRRPPLAAALSGNLGGDATEDTHTLFERIVRRVLTGLL